MSSASSAFPLGSDVNARNNVTPAPDIKSGLRQTDTASQPARPVLAASDRARSEGREKLSAADRPTGWLPSQEDKKWRTGKDNYE